MKTKFQKFYLKSEAYLFSALAMAYFAILLFQFPYLPDQDAYFHIKISEMMLETGWIIEKLPWMTQSIMADKYVDYHLFFQVFQIPFIAVFKDLILASKLSNILFLGFSIFAFLHLLKFLKVKKRWFWFLIFLVSSPIFTSRLLYGRGATLFVGIFFVFIYLFLSKRYWALGILSFVIMWTYPAFLVLIAFLVFYSLTCYLNKVEIPVKSLVYPFLGMALGFIIHPSFPNQFYGYWLEVFGRFFHPVGLEGTGEWSSPNAGIALPGIIIPVLLFIPTILFRKNESMLSKSLYGYSLLLLVYYFTAVRAIEYLMPILVLALSIQSWKKYPFQRSFFIVIVTILMIFSIPDNWKRFKEGTIYANIDKEFETAEWLKNHTPAKSVVMIPWDHFPRFFFKNIHNYYLNGLNPIYSFAKDSEKHSLVRSFFDGTATNFNLIPLAIQADYAVLKISPEHARSIESLIRLEREGEKSLKEIYRNEKYIIFQFKNIYLK